MRYTWICMVKTVWICFLLFFLHSSTIVAAGRQCILGIFNCFIKHSPRRYVFFMQTWQRLIRVLKSPAFSVSDWGLLVDRHKGKVRLAFPLFTELSFKLLLSSQFKVTLKYISGELVLYLRVFLKSDLSVCLQHQVTEAQFCPVSQYTQGTLINCFSLAYDVATNTKLEWKVSFVHLRQYFWGICL